MKHGEDTILNIPLNAGIAGTILGLAAAPWAIIIMTIATIGFKCRVELLKDNGEIMEVIEIPGNKTCIHNLTIFLIVPQSLYHAISNCVYGLLRHNKEIRRRITIRCFCMRERCVFLKWTERGMDMGIRYIVTGAAGHLGSTVIRLLQNTDSEVYGLLLPEEKASDLRPPIFIMSMAMCAGKKHYPRFFENADGKTVKVIHIQQGLSA